jgi:hypothetical protein
MTERKYCKKVVGGYLQKLVFAAPFLCLLVWLALTGSSKDSRIVALNEALASKQIGRIGEEDRQLLQRTVPALSRRTARRVRPKTERYSADPKQISHQVQSRHLILGQEQALP